jgi:SNF2 family DNA or RNA helicase
MIKGLQMATNFFIEEFDADKEGDNLKAEIEALDIEAKKKVEEVQSVYSAIDEIDEEEGELLAKLAIVKAKKKEQQDKQRKIQQEARAAEAKRIELDRKYQTFLSEKVIRDRMAEEIRAIEDKTANAPWRDRAYPHQISGAIRLASAKRAVLGDNTGLGKTATSIIYMDMVGAKKVLVVAPKDILKNFEKEIKNWAPHRKTLVAQGITKAVRDQLFMFMQSLDEYVLLINYEIWNRDPDFVEALVNLKFDTVVCDEAHTMRETENKAFQNVRRVVYAGNSCPVCGNKPESYMDNLTGKRKIRCSLCFYEPENFHDFCSVKNVLTISATNFVNKPQDFFAQLNLLDNVNFDKLNNYLRDYCDTTWDGKWRFKGGGEKRLIARMGARMVARTPDSAGVKMPDQIIVKHSLEFEGNLYSRQREAMKQIKSASLSMMSGDYELNMMRAIAIYTRLRQAVTYPAGIKVHDPKTGALLYKCTVEESIILDKAMDIGLRAIEEGDRVVMFSQFKEVLREMEYRLKKEGISVTRLDGDASDRLREEIKVDFDSKTANENDSILRPKSPDNPDGYKYQVVLCHFKVGGVGLNLDLARQMVIIDLPYNPAARDQARARINRINSKHGGSIVHEIGVKDTVTEWLEGIIQFKEDMIEGVENDMQMAQSLMDGLRDGTIM